MSKKTPCQICGRTNCPVDQEINEGCAKDVIRAEPCAVCQRRSYIVDPRTGFAIPCASCARGFRLKLWLKHKQDCGRKIEPFALAA